MAVRAALLFQTPRGFELKTLIPIAAGETTKVTRILIRVRRLR